MITVVVPSYPNRSLIDWNSIEVLKSQVSATMLHNKFKRAGRTSRIEKFEFDCDIAYLVITLDKIECYSTMEAAISEHDSSDIYPLSVQ